MVNTFQHKGKTITISMENVPDGHFYSIVKDEDGSQIVHKWIIDEPRPKSRLKYILVEYVHQEVTLSGRVIVEHPKESYTEHNYDYFYNLEVSGKQGEILHWNVLNGLLYRHLWVRPFKVDGTFFQPTVYDVEASIKGDSKRIAITTFEGIAPFMFSVDFGATWQSEPLFENLPAAQTTLLVRDADGNVNPRIIN